MSVLRDYREVPAKTSEIREVRLLSVTITCTLSEPEQTCAVTKWSICMLPDCINRAKGQADPIIWRGVISIHRDTEKGEAHLCLPECCRGEKDLLRDCCCFRRGTPFSRKHMLQGRWG